MAHIVVQMGHCFRRTGATGTHREQEFAKAIGTRLERRLLDDGHRVSLIGADDAVPKADAFVALHCDGSSNRSRRGFSVGYPDDKGAVLARVWKASHLRAGYPGPNLPDNYTDNLAGYYGFRKAAGTPYRFLAEHATTTNPDDEHWLETHLDAVADAHVEALNRVLGHPASSTPRVLGLGDSGDDVLDLQKALNAFGYGLVEDGDFGPQTDAAVRDFQARHGLTVDGLVGPQTRETLQSLNRDSWVIGSIRQTWLSHGGADGPLGQPLTHELKTPDGRGRFNHFDGGSVYWTPEFGAFAVWGDIRLAWERIGWERSPLGYPVSREVQSELPGFRVEQHFERGILLWTGDAVWTHHEIWRR